MTTTTLDSLVLADIEHKDWYFDEEAADLIVDFSAKFARHVKGEWAGYPVVLHDWEKEILREVFGWKCGCHHLRKYRKLYLEIPRKNGKSLLAAVIALFLFLCDREPGVEIYSAASDTKQARIVFALATQMIRLSPRLLRRVKILKNRIEYKDDPTCYYEVLSAEAKTKDGLNAHGIIFDELHAQPDRELYDVLRTSCGSRRQPLEVYITTAGHDRESICWKVHDYCVKVNDGIYEDPTFFGRIYGATLDDDWTSPSVWAKANPGFGTSPKVEYLAGECRTALAEPSNENTFKRNHLNIWTEAETIWIPRHVWDKCRREYTEQDLLGRACFAAADLSSTTDISALALVFPSDDFRKLQSLLYCWIPKEKAVRKEKEDGVPYRLWEKNGWVNFTEGNVIDYDYIIEFIDTMRQMYGFKFNEITKDPWNSTQFGTELIKRGYQISDFRQGFKSMSPAMKDMEALVASHQLQHNGNEILRWMISNTVVKRDPAGNIKPDKSATNEKIDGVVALIMAVARALANCTERSVYEGRGLRAL